MHTGLSPIIRILAPFGYKLSLNGCRIFNISDRENNPEIIFLEALILRETNKEKSNSLLTNIISNFPNNDYAEYSKNILKDG